MPSASSSGDVGDQPEDCKLSPVPCSSCLRLMAKWKPPEPIVQCFESDTASAKCKRCLSQGRGGGRVCIPATRYSSAASVRLRNILKGISSDNDSEVATNYRNKKEIILNAQLAAMKALRLNTELTKRPNKRKAMDEEADAALQVRSVVAAEATARAAKRAATAQKKSSKAVVQLVQLVEAMAENTSQLLKRVQEAA
ncbi:hypothetical protein QIS74_06632 [Colletotrichum tabaci]|uniref:Uncharacterized protein n=1 Tax=Colletotrichum tabaci TaxID=1209068 RepID=A0AAV9TC51_9PEZI